MPLAQASLEEESTFKRPFSFSMAPRTRLQPRVNRSSNTRLSSRAQLSRTGRRCAQFASHSSSCLELEHDLPCGVGLHALIGQSRARDVAAQLLQRLAVVGAAAHRGVQAETVDVGKQRLLEVRIPGHALQALHRQHLFSPSWPQGDATSTRRGLQRPEHAGFIGVAKQTFPKRNESPSTSAPAGQGQMRRLPSDHGQREQAHHDTAIELAVGETFGLSPRVVRNTAASGLTSLATEMTWNHNHSGAGRKTAYIIG